MVMLHPFNGVNIFGNGADGAGPAAGNLANNAYNYTSWNITGVITLDTGTSYGTTIKVQNDLIVTGRIQVDGEGDPGVTAWGSAANGQAAGAGGAGGAACGVAADRIETVTGQDFWSGWGESGWSGYVSGPVSLGPGRQRLVLLVGGKITLDMDPAPGPQIGATGGTGILAPAGGGGGGLVVLISGQGIEFTLQAPNPIDIPHIAAYGGLGAAGSAVYYGAGGGGGGAVILMAPKITGDDAVAIKVNGGLGGAPAAGVGTAGGGGGSFGAGGNSGAGGHTNGYPGGDGEIYKLLTSPLPLFR